MSVGSQRRDPRRALGSAGRSTSVCLAPGQAGGSAASGHEAMLPGGGTGGEDVFLASCVGAALSGPGLARKAASLVVINDPSGSPRSRRDIPALISHSWSEVSGLAAEGERERGWADGRTDGRAGGAGPAGVQLTPAISRSRGQRGGRSLVAPPEHGTRSRSSHLLLLPHPWAGRGGKAPQGLRRLRKAFLKAKRSGGSQ